MAAAPQDACWDPAEIAERFKKENAQNPHPGGMILAGERRRRLPKGGDDVIREVFKLHGDRAACDGVQADLASIRSAWR